MTNESYLLWAPCRHVSSGIIVFRLDKFSFSWERVWTRNEQLKWGSIQDTGAQSKREDCGWCVIVYFWGVKTAVQETVNISWYSLKWKRTIFSLCWPSVMLVVGVANNYLSLYSLPINLFFSVWVWHTAHSPCEKQRGQYLIILMDNCSELVFV